MEINQTNLSAQEQIIWLEILKERKVTSTH